MSRVGEVQIGWKAGEQNSKAWRLCFGEMRKRRWRWRLAKPVCRQESVSGEEGEECGVGRWRGLVDNDGDDQQRKKG